MKWKQMKIAAMQWIFLVTMCARRTVCRRTEVTFILCKHTESLGESVDPLSSVDIFQHIQSAVIRTAVQPEGREDEKQTL